MKAVISKEFNSAVKTTQFATDCLYRFYDFKNDERGEVIFDKNFIFRLYYKELISSEEVELAEKLIQLIKKMEVNNELSSNFVISWKKGKILAQVGHRCAAIKYNIEEYTKYLEDLKRNAMETRIEFTEDEDKIKEYDEYDEY